jgi:hypothetical protein
LKPANRQAKNFLLHTKNRIRIAAAVVSFFRVCGVENPFAVNLEFIKILALY